MSIKNTLSTAIHNICSFHTKRKLVVFQSDDWGAIRTPTKETFDTLVNKGIRLDKDIYSCNDALESTADVERLFDVLSSVKGSKGRYANFTANYVVTNPKFDEIKASEFTKYSYQLITDSYNEYYGDNPIEGICKQGIGEGIWTPQSHGREHLNVALWLKCLQDNNPELRTAFAHGMFALTKSLIPNFSYSFMEAYNSRTTAEEDSVSSIITQGLEIFENIFGYSSESFIAPNYVWGDKVEDCLHKNGVKYIQSGRTQILPAIHGNKSVKRYSGTQNSYGQIYISRNCSFEPTTDKSTDVVDQCLNEIAMAFNLKTPAIINSHRINYIGKINPKNSDDNLRLLAKLLKSIVQRWPDVEFVDTVTLGELIS